MVRVRVTERERRFKLKFVRGRGRELTERGGITETDRQTDRQTDRETERQRLKLK